MEEIRLHQFAEKLELLGYSKRVIADYPANIRFFFQYLDEKENVRSIADVLPMHLTAYHTHLQYGNRKNGTKLGRGTVCARLVALRTFYRIMYAEGLVPHDYAHLVLAPKHRSPLPKHVPTEKEMRTLLESIAPVNPLTVRDRALLELLYATGIRNEEARTLTVSSLDLEQKTLFVTGKGSKDRVVPVGDWVVPYLLEYLIASRPRLINPKEPTDLLFVSKNGRRIINCNLNTLIGKYAMAAGLENRITPHSFRHACATHLLKAGADIRYVQELLGHADLSSTQIYTKLDITFLKQAHKKYHPRERTGDDGR